MIRRENGDYVTDVIQPPKMADFFLIYRNILLIIIFILFILNAESRMVRSGGSRQNVPIERAQ